MAAWPYNTARWQRLRKEKLARDPLCQGCKRIMPAKAVDHVKPISDGGDPFPDLDGLRSYCLSHHSQKTARGAEAGAVKTTRKLQPRKGCDANGNPLDPMHPWHDMAGHEGKTLKTNDRTRNGTGGIANIHRLGGRLSSDLLTIGGELQPPENTADKTAAPLRTQLVRKSG